MSENRQEYNASSGVLAAKAELEGFIATSGIRTASPAEVAGFNRKARRNADPAVQRTLQQGVAMAAAVARNKAISTVRRTT